MFKLFKTLILISMLSISPSLSVNASDIVEINSLIENAKEFDGQEVTIQGEAIGEPMNRGNYSWINISDGTNAIGVWIDTTIVSGIHYYGDYKNKGDIIKVTGIFNKACKEHGGESDFHNNVLEIIETGHPVERQIATSKILFAAVLSGVALIWLIISVRKLRENK